MSFKKICLTTSILFCCYTMLAQQKESTEAPLKVLKMPKFSIGSLPKKSIAVSGIEIIQTVWDSTRLGYVQKGAASYVAAIRPAKPLTIFLQEHFDKLYKDDFKTEGLKILWVVKDLRVSERTTMGSNLAYTRFNVSAYIGGKENNYAAVAEIDTVMIASGADVTAWHGERIESAFKLLLQRTLNNAKKIPVHSDTLTLDDILFAEKQKINIPILKVDTYTDGLYADFQEFVQNKPSVINYLPVAVEKNKVQFVTTNQNNQLDTLQAWGVCKDGEMYKYSEGNLIAIEKKGNGFIISDYVEQVSRRNSNAFAQAFIGGLVGGIAGAAIVSSLGSAKNKPCLVRSIPYITKNLPEASSIDMSTGEWTF